MSNEAKEPTAGRRTASGFMYVLFASLAWSVVPLGIKYMLRQALTPTTIAFSRFVLASGSLWLLARTSGRVRPVTRGDIPLLLMGGLGMCGNYVLYAIGLQYTTASATNIIVQDQVIALVILSHFVLGERISPLKILGMLFALMGIGVVFWSGSSVAALIGSKALVGNVMIFFAGLSWVLYGLAQKLLSRREISNVYGLAWIFGIAAAASAIPAALDFRIHGPLTPAVFGWLLVVGVISTALAYVLLARAFDKLSASTVSVVTCMLPIFTLVMARIFLKEFLTPSIVLGALFVVAGILIIGRDEATSQAR